jgi:phenylacetic acid degradation operon negative regulatory protein
MVSCGDIRMNDGWYELEAGLLARQQRQDRGRTAETVARWNGQWHTAIVTADRRPADERAHSRTVLTEAHLAELREGVWIRPETSELTAPLTDLSEQGWIFATTTFRQHPDVAQLWNLAGWIDRAHGLSQAVNDLLPALEAGDRSSLPRGFIVAAGGLRLFRDDPLLPRELLAAAWPRAEFQERYDRFDRSYRSVLKAFFDESR